MRPHSQAIRGVFTFVLLVACAACNRPRFLNRWTAANAIEDSAQFQHKTKWYFRLGERRVFDGYGDGFEGTFGFISDHLVIVSDSVHPCRSDPTAQCEDFYLSTTGQRFFDQYMQDGLLKKSGDAYELAVGTAHVYVNGIVRDGIHAKVDFVWRFGELNDLGQDVVGNKGEPLQGYALLTKYDDGWRITTLNVDDPMWCCGPKTWPDIGFNWGAFDEDENSFSRLY